MNYGNENKYSLGKPGRKVLEHTLENSSFVGLPEIITTFREVTCNSQPM